VTASPDTWLVDFADGVVHGDAFSSEEVFEAELGSIFRRSWLFLAPESQVSGRPFATWMGPDAVIVDRSATGRLRARSSGTVLRPVPRVEVLHGLVFGCWDAAAPPLLDAAGSALGEVVAGFGSTAPDALGPLRRWTIDHNWKTCVASTRTDRLVFPTFSYLPDSQIVRVWHPRGPHRTEVWAWVLVEAQTPPELRAAVEAFADGMFPADGALAGTADATPARPGDRIDATNRLFYEQWTRAFQTRIAPEDERDGGTWFDEGWRKGVAK